MGNSIELTEMQQVQLMALKNANITEVRFLPNSMILWSKRKRVNIYTYPNEQEKWKQVASKYNEGKYSLDEIIKEHCPLAK